MLSEGLKQAIQDEYYEHGQCRHTNVSHCHSLTLVGAMWRAEEDIDNDEDLTEAQTYLMDTVLSSLILRGFIEPAGMNEDGELTYQTTPKGNQGIESFARDNQEGNN